MSSQIGRYNVRVLRSNAAVETFLCTMLIFSPASNFARIDLVTLSSVDDMRNLYYATILTGFPVKVKPEKPFRINDLRAGCGLSYLTEILFDLSLSDIQLDWRNEVGVADAVQMI